MPEKIMTYLLNAPDWDERLKQEFNQYSENAEKVLNSKSYPCLCFLSLSLMPRCIKRISHYKKENIRGDFKNCVEMLMRKISDASFLEDAVDIDAILEVEGGDFTARYYVGALLYAAGTRLNNYARSCASRSKPKYPTVREMLVIYFDGLNKDEFEVKFTGEKIANDKWEEPRDLKPYENQFPARPGPTAEDSLLEMNMEGCDLSLVVGNGAPGPNLCERLIGVSTWAVDSSGMNRRAPLLIQNPMEKLLSLYRHPERG